MKHSRGLWVCMKICSYWLVRWRSRRGLASCAQGVLALAVLIGLGEGWAVATLVTFGSASSFLSLAAYSFIYSVTPATSSSIFRSGCCFSRTTIMH